MSNGTQKKGLSPLAWIGIGCGALALLAVIAVAGVVGFGVFKAKEFAADLEANPAKTTAEMIVRVNPELELVDTDDEAGTMTIRNTKTGEEATLNFEDIAEGKFSVTTAEGEFTVDATDAVEGDGEGSVTFKGPDGEARIGSDASLENVPDWVPIYPDATQIRGNYSAVTSEGVGGLISCSTGDGAQEVIAYYKKKLEDEGYEIKGQTSTTTPDGSVSTIIGELTAHRRTLIVGAAEQKGETQVTINYNAKAE